MVKANRKWLSLVNKERRDKKYTRVVKEKKYNKWNIEEITEVDNEKLEIYHSLLLKLIKLIRSSKE